MGYSILYLAYIWEKGGYDIKNTAHTILRRLYAKEDKSVTKTCLRCNAYFDGDVCEICYDPTANYVEEIEEYKGYKILKYKTDTGYRVDFGTKRSKMVMTVEDAQKLIDCR
ncbi:hypothetical protein D3C74_208220 [compost metagenome]